MKIEPKIRGFICTTAHPDGCRLQVKHQIDYIRKMPKSTNGPKKVLVIGASMGYGLSSRIAAAYNCHAATIGVIYDKPASGKRTASAGWYNTAAFEAFAAEDGLYAATINGDAFSEEVKQRTAEQIRKDLGKVDMVVYSLASPRRTTPDGTTYTSVLKTIGAPYTNKTIDLSARSVCDVTVEPASEAEIADTIRVMGGEDWKDWINYLQNENVLEENAVTLAYSYIGPEQTHPMYRNGSIGQAKKHLLETARELTASGTVHAYIAVNKALVTQSSAAIPIVPLYITLLYQIMKKKGNHEGCTEQMYRLFHDKLDGTQAQTDEEGQIRLDDYEMLPEIQQEIQEIWKKIDEVPLESVADIDGYWDDFYQIFGFRVPGVDYTKDTNPQIDIPSLR